MKNKLASIKKLEPHQATFRVGKNFVPAILMTILLFLLAFAYVKATSLDQRLSEAIKPTKKIELPKPPIPPNSPMPIKIEATLTPMPIPTSKPRPSPTNIVVVIPTTNPDPIVDCVFKDHCEGSYPMKKSLCLDVVCCEVGGFWKITNKTACTNEQKIENEAKSASAQSQPTSQPGVSAEEFQRQIDEINANLLEVCRQNVYRQYPVAPNGETPERRTLRTQGLQSCFNTYAL